MKLSGKYSLETKCYLKEKENNDIQEIFDDLPSAKEATARQECSVDDIHYAYVIIDENGEVPEEFEEIYMTPEEAVKDFLSKQ